MLVKLRQCPPLDTCGQVDCIHRVDTVDLAVLEYVQASMPARWMMVHSNSSDSGRARGMEESPFVAAERFESKKDKLMADAKVGTRCAPARLHHHGVPT